MSRLLLILVFVSVAAAVAYLWVVPGAIEETGAIRAEAPVEEPPAKDTSRVGGAADEPAPVEPTGANGSGTLPVVSLLDVDALPFDAECGMSLTRQGEEGVIFTDSVRADGVGTMAAAMNIDGALVVLARDRADGEPLEFGQYPRQVFVSGDQQVQVVTEVELGEPGGQGELPVLGGTLTVMKAGLLTLQFPVSGSAGC